MKLTSMQKMLAVVALMAVAVIAVVVLLILPKFGEMAQLDADIQAAKDRVAQTQTLMAQLQQAKAQASVTQTQLLELSNRMPESPQLPSLIIELQDISNASSVRFDRIQVSDPENVPGTQYTEIPLALNLTGKWSDVLDYLRRVNRLTRGVRVTDLSLTPPGARTTTDTASPALTVTMQMRAYVMAVNGAAPAAPAAPAAVKP
jgi:type IV pilus assembly protein PilO